MSERRVRVRFAPSPTGPLHIGGVRTALFNYLFAKKHGGDFLLRIEDTDQTRYVPGAEDYIVEALEWCGIIVDEGVRNGGPYGPYRQSDRKAIYEKYALQLIASGNAYYAFDTPEELEAMRQNMATPENPSPQYDSKTRVAMKNSLTLSNTEVESLLAANYQYVIRFKMPLNEDVLITDLIRGAVSVNTSTLDDKVLFKSDGMPTYHLANVVDDYLMKITHVVRGEEWLPSCPLHVLLYRSLGWEADMPQFSHLPLLLKPSGQGKLSKRDGDKLGFPVFPLRWTDPASGEVSSGYRETGYLRDAFVNMLALLGWNPGTEQEIFTQAEMIQAFSLERVGKSGSKFDPEKAKWFNQQYLKAMPNDDLGKLYAVELEKKGITKPVEFIAKVAGFCKERCYFVHEFWNVSSFFFVTPEKYDADVIKKRWKPEVPAILIELAGFISTIDSSTAESVDKALHHYIEQKALNMGLVMNSLRLCLTGGSIGPSLAEIIALIGKEESVKRINLACSSII